MCSPSAGGRVTLYYFIHLPWTSQYQRNWSYKGLWCTTGSVGWHTLPSKALLFFYYTQTVYLLECSLHFSTLVSIGRAMSLLFQSPQDECSGVSWVHTEGSVCKLKWITHSLHLPPPHGSCWSRVLCWWVEDGLSPACCCVVIGCRVGVGCCDAIAAR